MLPKDSVVVSKLWITGYSLWSRLSYRCDSCKPMKNSWESVLSLCGLEVGLPAFQLPLFAKCDALLKRGLCDMFVNRIQAFCEIQACIPHQKLEVPESGSALQLRLESCFQKIELWYPSFGLQAFDCDLGCLIDATAASQWGIPVLGPCPRALSSGLVLGPCPRALSSGLVLGPCPRALSLGLVLGPLNQLLASVGWKWGCQPFSCPRSQNVTHCQNEVYATCLFKESRPFVKSKLPLPTRTLMSLRAAALFTGSLSLHHACKR